MEFIEDSNFDDYINKYKNLSLKEKKELVEQQIEELLVVLKALNEQCGKKPKILFNREILDLKREGATEDDFVEAMFVYSYSIKELLASFVESVNIRR
ncbi:MAG: hypothetical protein ACI4XM_04165 [Candidatus Coprovivens sp.]